MAADEVYIFHYAILFPARLQLRYHRHPCQTQNEDDIYICIEWPIDKLRNLKLQSENSMTWMTLQGKFMDYGICIYSGLFVQLSHGRYGGHCPILTSPCDWSLPIFRFIVACCFDSTLLHFRASFLNLF
jgi:hypothetical protein